MTEELKTIDTVDTSPFKKMVMTIGELPTSFVESMTYYEMLAWLCNYLENTVIPAVNNNAEAVEELQGLFVELKSYVDSYFDNLDVQEEINNKLDALVNDGTLERLIGAYIQPRIDAQNAEIAEIRGIAESVASGSPLVATSIDDMTDTTRIYVNTSDGKWYYYDGDSWEIGGTYQTAGIGNGEVDVLNLKNDLQSNFLIKYSDPIELGTPTSGYYDKDGVYHSSSSLVYNTISLTAGKIYLFNNLDMSNVSGIVIVDSNDNVVYASNTANTSKNNSYIFKCNENGMHAYLSYNPAGSQTSIKNIIRFARTIDGVYNQLKYTSSVFTPLMNITPAYLTATGVGSNNLAYNTNVTTANMKIYQACKGRTYRITCTDYSNICGYCLTDENLVIKAYSSNSNIGSTYNTDTYTFTPEDDGFIFLTQISDDYEVSINVISENIEIGNDISPLTNKYISYNGDSICAGSGYNGGYGKIIGEKYNMTVQNIAVGGATITPNTYSGDNPRHWISTSITNMSATYDYAILEGGVNDASLQIPLGEISDGFTATLDTNTYYGAFENMLKQLISRFKGKKYGYIAVHQMQRNFRITNDPSTSYYWASRKCCEKWGVPFLDLNDKIPPFAFFPSDGDAGLYELRTTYTKDGDGWHPNEAGYKKYYVDKIAKWLESL